jgi:hypothetical protein
VVHEPVLSVSRVQHVHRLVDGDRAAVGAVVHHELHDVEQLEWLQACTIQTHTAPSRWRRDKRQHQQGIGSGDVGVMRHDYTRCAAVVEVAMKAVMEMVIEVTMAPSPSDYDDSNHRPPAVTTATAAAAIH